ncbi:NAD(P)/FAD-dependent oxidoreductase [Acetobacter sp.]|uniref:NAD(P)/FAD-dependent oxidoreductase n=1 Tax=Acetobacter sp. TaxID=440 RepID=UPI0025C4C467|nr:FAD-binding oxidoreductase [Acetobacter sp.]MCH4092023.1 FAD-binding oxidoreductase [Acetobacter sp.]MCI1300722.1 FAD-binding oxidoreductase [Acetobacter sp.]MCI1317525.1 FAD-binding oxidoreductase [Acetobacter sp.]
MTTLADLAQGHVTDLAMQPYWWRLMPPETAGLEQLPKKTDVAIVGSGFTGLSAALTLACEGRSVTVLEAGRLGFGASTRNGGQVGSGNQKFRVATLIEMMGIQKAEAMLREGVAMLDHIDALVHELKIECFFVRCGRFRGAVRPEHYEAMARDMEDLRRHARVESFMVPRSEQHREIDTDYFFGGSVLPQDASLHPGLYHAGLSEAAAKAGVQLIGETPVRAVQPETNGFSVHTDRGIVRARNVIIATNGYRQDFNTFCRKRIVPVTSSLIATTPMNRERLEALFPAGRVYGNSARVFSYFRKAPDEPRIIWGGRVGRNAGEMEPRAYAHLARDMLKVFPQIADVGVAHAWSGRIGYTFDEFPHLGRTPDGIHYAMGYCGTGVSRSTWFGRKIALQLMGKPEGFSEFTGLRFPSHFFQAFAPMAVPFVEQWYRSKDALEK